MNDFYGKPLDIHVAASGIENPEKVNILNVLDNIARMFYSGKKIAIGNAKKIKP